MYEDYNQQILSNLAGNIKFGEQEEYAKIEEEIKKNAIEHLRKVQSTMREQEANFGNIKQLYKKIQDFTKNYPFNEFAKNYNLIKDVQGQITDVLNKVKNLFITKVNENLGSDSNLESIVDLENLFNNGKRGKNNESKISITFSLSKNKDDGYKPKITFTGNRGNKQIDQGLYEAAHKARTEIQNTTFPVGEKNKISLDGYEIYKDGVELINDGTIAINRSIAGVEGALGEAYWFSCLKKCGCDPQMVGVVGKDINGKEIPIDIIAKSLGFQVKNYLEIGKKIYFSSGQNNGELRQMSAYPFIANYLGQKKTADIINQYGRWGKNGIPNSAVQNALGLYSKVNIAKVANFDRKRRLSKDNKLNLNNETAGRPAIWLINDKIISSADLIDDIINQIDNSNSDAESLITIRYEEGPEFSWSEEEEVRGNYCNLSSVKYKIFIDMGKYTDYLNKKIGKV